MKTDIPTYCRLSHTLAVYSLLVSHMPTESQQVENVPPIPQLQQRQVVIETASQVTKLESSSDRVITRKP